MTLVSCKHTGSYVNKHIKSEGDVYREYLDFFEEVFKKMNENYYKPIDRKDFERFISQFDAKIYGQLKATGKSSDFIRWRSAAFLIDFLKNSEDIFSAFYPPKPAKEYEQTALGKRVDLGIEGDLQEDGYVVSQVEPRSDAYIQGLRIRDSILEIDSLSVGSLGDERIGTLLNPLVDTQVNIKFLSLSSKTVKSIDVRSQEYFKQTVFSVPVPIDGIYGIEIKRFNRKTSEDLLRFLESFKSRGVIKGLIVDLRGNPGGPPLAAREISSFFLSGGEDFSYFHKRGHQKAMLDVPSIPAKYHYQGPMVILIDKKSGSASELFSGIMQKRGRAVLMGTNSAGQVMLKSMFHFDDESMLLLVTGRGYHPDGTVFSFSGLDPDRFIKEEEEEDIIKYAAAYLLYADKIKP